MPSDFGCYIFESSTEDSRISVSEVETRSYVSAQLPLYPLRLGTAALRPRAAFIFLLHRVGQIYILIFCWHSRETGFNVTDSIKSPERQQQLSGYGCHI